MEGGGAAGAGGETDQDDGAGAGVDDAQQFVLGRGGEQTAVSVPAQRVDRVVVRADDAQRARRSRVPQHALEVHAGAEQDRCSCRVPLYQGDLLRMTLK